MKLTSRIAMALATMLALFFPTMAPANATTPAPTCLLYTSDAADE